MPCICQLELHIHTWQQERIAAVRADRLSIRERGREKRWIRWASSQRHWDASEARRRYFCALLAHTRAEVERHISDGRIELGAYERRQGLLLDVLHAARISLQIQRS